MEDTDGGKTTHEEVDDTGTDGESFFLPLHSAFALSVFCEAAYAHDSAADITHSIEQQLAMQSDPICSEVSDMTKINHEHNHAIYFICALSDRDMGWSDDETKRDTVVVAFRGSSNTTEFLEDARSLRCAEFKSSSGDHLAWAGNGFIAAYQNLRNVGLLDKVITLSASCDHRLVITGHSLGGAIATLMALELYKTILNESNKGYKLALVTYGCPRTLRESSAKEMCRFRGVVFGRFVNYGDLIPTVPDEAYMHCCYPYVYGYSHTHMNEWTLVHDRDYGGKSMIHESYMHAVDCHSVTIASSRGYGKHLINL